MSDLKQTRERLYAVMERVPHIFKYPDVSPELCMARVKSAAWQRFYVVQKHAIETRDPIALAGLIEQMDAALAEVERISDPSP